MKIIDANDCITSLLNKFPEFKTYWRNHLDYWGEEQGINLNLMSFGQYVIDVFHKNDEKKTQEIFEYLEFLMTNGDQAVQEAIATGLLEYLYNLSNRNPCMHNFEFVLGKNCREYIEAWKKTW